MGIELTHRTSVAFETATVAHAHELAPLLRQQDVDEVLAGGHADGLEALVLSVECSSCALAVRFDGQLACLIGLAEPGHLTLLGTPAVGCLWFLTGTACDKFPLTLVRTAKQVVPGLHQASGYPELRNVLDARYTGALRLAQAVGFEILATVPYGPRGLPFHLVSRRA